MTPAAARGAGRPGAPGGPGHSGLANEHTGGLEWSHGSRTSPGELDTFTDLAAMHPDAYEDPDGESLWSWNAVLGTHFAADHEVAREFARGEHESSANEAGGPGYDFEGIVHPQLDIRNPAVYALEHDLDHEAYEAEFAAGNHPGNYLPDDEWAADSWPVACEIRVRWGTSEIPANALDRGIGGAGLHPARSMWLASHPDKHGIAGRFKQRLIARGHDGIVYGNEYERSQHGEAGNRAVIAFDPAQIRITGHHHADEWCAEREPDMTDREAG
jgi:hypothetical protein